MNNFIKLLDAFGLRQHITVPTHIYGPTLDLVITAADYEPSHICVDPPVYSDHGLITCSLPVIQRPEAARPTINITTRKLSSLDRHEFSTMLRQSQICAITIQTFADCSTADLCAAYNATLRCILDDLAPAQVLAVKYCPRSSWFDGYCRDARRLVRSLERRYRRTKAPEDLAAWKKQLAIKHTLLTSKEAAYWTASISACNGNTKQLWGCLNSLMQRDSVSPHQPAVTAESLSLFFLSEVKAIRACAAQCTPPKFIDQQNSNLGKFLPCTITEIRQVIQCSPAKSCELDPVSHLLFMESIEQLLPFIHLICNTSLRDGVLPDAEKHAIVTPILKKADLDLDNTKSYRDPYLICLLCLSLLRVLSLIV